MALIHSISITDLFFIFTNSGTVFSSVLINFSRCEPFSARQKGRNRRYLSWERLLANQRWRLGPSEISEHPAAFGIGYVWHRVADTFRIRGVDVSDQGTHPCVIEPIPRASFLSFPLPGHARASSPNELRLGISTLGIIVENRAKRPFPRPLYSAWYFVWRATRRKIAKSKLSKLLKISQPVQLRILSYLSHVTRT